LRHARRGRAGRTSLWDRTARQPGGPPEGVAVTWNQRGPCDSPAADAGVRRRHDRQTLHALIISAGIPPDPALGDFGNDRRLRLFVDAIGRVCDRMSFLHFVPETFLTSGGADSFTSETVWRIPGTMHFAPYARRQETFANYYLKGIVAARHGKAFFTTTGVSQLDAVRAALTSGLDLVFAFELPAMLPLLAVRPAAPVLFDLNDLIHRVHRRAATSPPLRPGKVAHLLQVPAILADERRAIRLAVRTSVCADADARFLARLGAGSKIVVVPNAVTCPAQAPPVSPEPTLLFLGKYNYEPNVMAAERLVRRIWPLVRRARPDARLMLAGGDIERLPSAAAPPPGVEYLGFVPDLEQLYARTRVACCPLDVAGGTRLKLIEAAAYARPMVSTRIGAEGLAFRGETEILLRDDDAGFAAACVELLGDDVRCGQLGSAARRRMIQSYEASNVRDQISALVGEVVIAQAAQSALG